MEIREKIIKLMKEFEKINKENSDIFEIAMYLYCRFDIFDVNNYSSETELQDIKKILDKWDGSIFESSLNEEIEKIFFSEEN